MNKWSCPKELEKRHRVRRDVMYAHDESYPTHVFAVPSTIDQLSLTILRLSLTLSL
jgi:hypothetical protein